MSHTPETHDEGGEHQPEAGLVAAERAPLRAGQIFLDEADRAAIRTNLETAYRALNHAFRDIWIKHALDHGWAREYWHEHHIHQLAALTRQTSEATEQAHHALTHALAAHQQHQQAATEHEQ